MSEDQQLLLVGGLLCGALLVPIVILARRMRKDSAVSRANLSTRVDQVAQSLRRDPGEASQVEAKAAGLQALARGEALAGMGIIVSTAAIGGAVALLFREVTPLLDLTGLVAGLGFLDRARGHRKEARRLRRLLAGMPVMPLTGPGQPSQAPSNGYRASWPDLGDPSSSGVSSWP